MKTAMFGNYMDAMKSHVCIETILDFVQAATDYRGQLTVFHYDLANLYLKRCKQ